MSQLLCQWFDDDRNARPNRMRNRVQRMSLRRRRWCVLASAGGCQAQKVRESGGCVPLPDDVQPKTLPSDEPGFALPVIRFGKPRRPLLYHSGTPPVRPN